MVFGIFRQLKQAETDAEMVSRFSGEPSGLQKDEIALAAVTGKFPNPAESAGVRCWSVAAPSPDHRRGGSHVPRDARRKEHEDSLYVCRAASGSCLKGPATLYPRCAGGRDLVPRRLSSKCSRQTPSSSAGRSIQPFPATASTNFGSPLRLHPFLASHHCQADRIGEVQPDFLYGQLERAIVMPGFRNGTCNSLLDFVEVSMCGWLRPEYLLSSQIMAYRRAHNSPRDCARSSPQAHHDPVPKYAVEDSPVGKIARAH